MSRDSNKNKIRKMPGRFSGVSIKNILTLNIVTIIFAFLFIYMILSFIIYKTSNEIESYQVISGPLSRNESYTGLAIRNEYVVKADNGGYITYYVREGNKINANGVVYSLSENKSTEGNTELSFSEKMKIKAQMSSFASNFSSSHYNTTYSFKYELEGSILQYAGDDDINNGTAFRAKEDGIVLYSKDGYEGKTLDSIQEEDFNRTSYQEQDLKTDDFVKAGDDVYTIITDERWSLVIPLTDKQAVELADRETIRVKFQKDDHTQTGDFSLMERDGKKYGVIAFEKGMIRYAADRFLDIELVTNSQTGLKIPLNSILTKDFYVVPASYLTINENNEYGFMKITGDAEKNVQEFVAPTIYGQKQKERTEDLDAGQSPTYLYYIDMNTLKAGDVIVEPGTGEKYSISEVGQLSGVYCINKGYAVFRRVEIIDQNEEFAIVDPDTSYGLVLYDHIAKNYNHLKKDDILY